jgi:hypothetical protein
MNKHRKRWIDHLKVDEPAAWSGAEACPELVSRWAAIQADCNEQNGASIRNQEAAPGQTDASANERKQG